MENAGMILILNLVVYADPVSELMQSMLLELKVFNTKHLLQVSVAWEFAVLVKHKLEVIDYLMASDNVCAVENCNQSWLFPIWGRGDQLTDLWTDLRY